MVPLLVTHILSSTSWKTSWSYSRHSRMMMIAAPNFIITTSAAAFSTKTNNKNSPKHKNMRKRKRKIAVIGGGASGIFASIHAASSSNKDMSVSVDVWEASRTTLQKVKISGGGRCNVMHDTTKFTDISELLNHYPRGNKELRGVMTKHFTANDAKQWFEQIGGVQLKTEQDGRMFPITDDSQTIVNALLRAANDAGVSIHTGVKVVVVRNQNNDESAADDGSGTATNYFDVTLKHRRNNSQKKQTPEGTTAMIQQEKYDAVILATGSAPAGYQLVRRGGTGENDGLDLDFVDTVPSLFTLNTKHAVSSVVQTIGNNNNCDDGTTTTVMGLLHNLSGVSVPHAKVAFRLPSAVSNTNKNNESTTGKMKKQPPPTTRSKRNKKPKWLEQEGPLLITHRGLSGPAALKLSAYGARELAQARYRGQLRVHWAPALGNTADDVFAELWKIPSRHPKRMVATYCPLFVPTDELDDENYDNNNHESDDHHKDTATTRTRTAIPKRLWASLVRTAGMEADLTWGQVSKKMIRKLASQIASCEIEMTGKGTFKEEFVTAGGVSLKALDMKTMQSKQIPGLFLCGELIDVDGVTGGFNFLNCWSTGYLAGTSAAAYVRSLQQTENAQQ